MPQRGLCFLDVVVDLQTDMALLQVSAGKEKKSLLTKQISHLEQGERTFLCLSL